MEPVAFLFILGFAAAGAASYLEFAAAMREDEKRVQRRRAMIQNVIDLRIMIAREELERSRRVAEWNRSRLGTKPEQ